jgi:hypothetical protein
LAIANISSPTAIIPISNNLKSDIAICDDVSSQNTSDIEFSLASENSINELPPKSGRKSNTNANSDPVFKKTVSVISPSLSTRDKKSKERKASSCQSTPLFGRHKHTIIENEVKKVLTFHQDMPKECSRACELKNDTKKSQTIVIAPTSKPSTTITSISSSLPCELVHTISTITKKGQKLSKKHHEMSLEYEITYENDDGNQSPHGFISSFNQLTSQRHPSAIISANLKKPLPVALKNQQQEVERTAQQNIGEEHKSQDIELDELAIDLNGSKKKKKRKSKFYYKYIQPSSQENYLNHIQGHTCRNVDSVVYPTTSSEIKQQCILSKPPNQPM